MLGKEQPEQKTYEKYAASNGELVIFFLSRFCLSKFMWPNTRMAVFYFPIYIHPLFLIPDTYLLYPVYLKHLFVGCERIMKPLPYPIDHFYLLRHIKFSHGEH